MHILSQNQCLITQQLIGSVFVVEKRMDGQLFNFIVLLILVTQWMLELKYVISWFPHDSHLVSNFQSGTDIVIFAYGLEDPDMSKKGGQINYHENRRGTRIIPLRSYAIPPPESKFAGLDYFDFQLHNVS